jgi:EmrB/QacA subfamily drug resistance transporter
MDEKRTILLICILASFVSFLDGSVVNVALPAISHDFGGGLFLQQWVVDAYLLTLGSLILIAGSLADVFGNRRIMKYGLYGFAATSILCALAPNGLFLILGRGLQGVAGALLVPSSLALIIATFKDEAQGKAIGTWTAWTGISFLIGPLLGGFLVDAASWRLIFAINIVPIVVSLWLLHVVHAAEATDRSRKIDFAGALLCGAGLFGTVFALIEEPHFGWSHPIIYIPFVLGIFVLVAFLFQERSHRDPMLPLHLFAARNFAYGNVATFAIYAALSIATFVITVFLQQVAGYSALEAGLSLIPVTIIMFFLSSRFGSLATRWGPRFFMTAGPLIAAAGFFSMLRVTMPINYWSGLLPGILVFGLGLSITVAPLTAAILGSRDSAQAGIGSAVNNAISRIAGLLAIAFLGIIVGESITIETFKQSILVASLLLVFGGVVSFIGIRNTRKG